MSYYHCINCRQPIPSLEYYCSNNHFYHLECIQSPNFDPLSVDCYECILSLFPSLLPHEKCRRCSDPLICPKSINLCQRCYNSASNQCSMCGKHHVQSILLCKHCKVKIMKNKISSFFSTYCENCSFYFCFYCNYALSENTIVCSENHRFHSECYNKFPHLLKYCSSCLSLYDSLIANKIGNKVGEVCKICRGFNSNSISQCLQDNYFCQSCIDSQSFSDYLIDCFCEGCLGYKKDQENNKNLISQCSFCTYVQVCRFRTPCRQNILCYFCCNRFQSKIIICTCPLCENYYRNITKICVICLSLFNCEKNSSCEKQNNYCSPCLSNKFLSIPEFCGCKFCLATYNEKVKKKNVRLTCKICNGLLNSVQSSCRSTKVYCNSCVEQGHRVYCECSSCNSITRDKYCSIHNRELILNQECKHLYCIACVILANYYKIIQFLSDYKKLDFNNLKERFTYGCPFNNCPCAISISSRLLISLMDIVTKEDRELLTEFTPYLDGSPYKFKGCKCTNIIAYNQEEVNLRCYCG